MVLSFPVLPVKITIGKEKEVASPSPTAISPVQALDPRDLAIICMSFAAVFLAAAVVLLAYTRMQTAA